jgi:hypothetical protein
MLAIKLSDLESSSDPSSSSSPERKQAVSGFATPDEEGSTSSCVTPDLSRLSLHDAATPLSDGVPSFGANVSGVVSVCGCPCPLPTPFQCVSDTLAGCVAAGL